MSVAGRLERWLVAHPSNPLRLPEFQPREQMTARTILNPISFASAASSQTA
jgi:hypothetical protein